MSDLINRQDAIDAVSKWLHDVFGIKEDNGTPTIFKRLRELPSIEPKQSILSVNVDLSDEEVKNMLEKVKNESISIIEPERKKGKWIGKPIAGYCTVRCSVCNDVFLENSGKWNFCPNCGADMREKEGQVDDII